MKNINYKKELLNTLLTIVAAALSAFGLHVFVYPASFAPAGIDGVATMLQEISGLNAGYYSLMINVPLLIVAWFFLKKKYVIYTVVFTVLSSIMLVILETLSFYQYQDVGAGLISAVFSGVMLGVRTGIMLKLGASSGGVDIIASIVQSRRVHGNIEKIITLICYAIIGVSYFLYNDLNSILLSVIQMFVFEKASAVIMKETRNAVVFKIVTRNPDEIKNDIIYVLKHGATIVESKGMFTNEGSSIIISVVNIRQIPEFLKITKKYPDTFVYYSDVTGVNGNFRWFKDDVAK
ncbi:MAG: YitT family protein [Clostridia bacterium]|nr:YitT family protein [Clostridia bacterium]